jgi:hypothetical protein
MGPSVRGSADGVLAHLLPALSGLLILGTGWWFGREKRGGAGQDAVASR